MALAGRRREIAQVERLLERAGQGSGGVLVLAGLDMPGLLAALSVSADEWVLRRDGPDWPAGPSDRNPIAASQPAATGPDQGSCVPARQAR